MKKIMISAKHQLILSFLLMLVIPTIIMSITLRLNDGIINKNVNEYNFEKLLRQKNNTDIVLSQMDALYYSITNDYYIRPILMEGTSGINSVMASKAVQNICLYNERLTDILLVSEENDIVVHSNGATQLKYFAYSRFGSSEKLLKEWENLYKSEYSGDFFITEIGGYAGKRYFPVYAKTIYQNGKKTNFFAVINIEKVTDSQGEEETFGIIDYHNNIVKVGQGMESIDEIKFEKMNEKEGMLASKDKKYVVMYTESIVKDWKYVIISSPSIFMNGVDEVTTIAICGILMSLLLGVVFAMLLSKRNYAPINRMVRDLQRITKREWHSGDEYKYVNDAINFIEAENVELNMMKNRDMQIIKERCLEDLLTYNMLDVDIYKKMRNCNIVMDKEYFAVLRIKLYEYNSEMFGKNIDLLMYAMKNISEEVVNETHKAYVTKCHGEIFIIVNFDAEISGSTFEPVAKKIIDVLCNAIDVGVDVFVSRRYDTLSGIHDAYRDVVGADEYKTVLDCGEIILCDEHIGVNNDFSYVYESNTEYKIIKSILCGEYDTFKETVDGIYNDFSDRGDSLPSTTMKLLTYEIIGSIVKAMNELKKHKGIECPMITISELSLIGNMPLVEARKRMDDVVEQVCDFVLRENIKESNISRKIKKIVDESYMDQNLNVSAIADRLKMNSAYVSRIFKDENGETLLEYISRKRIEKAIKYLKEDKNTNIEKLAQMCGFSNARTFRRVFTKYVGTPPSKYVPI